MPLLRIITRKYNLLEHATSSDNIVDAINLVAYNVHTIVKPSNSNAHSKTKAKVNVVQSTMLWIINTVSVMRQTSTVVDSWSCWSSPSLLTPLAQSKYSMIYTVETVILRIIQSCHVQACVCWDSVESSTALLIISRLSSPQRIQLVVQQKELKGVLKLVKIEYITNITGTIHIGRYP